MCLISFHWQPNSQTPLTLVANRDEFHGRPARTAQFWESHPHLLAGKDLTAGGTWLGVTRSGYFAALTNVRQVPAPHKGEISRGQLVLDFLAHEPDPLTYLQSIEGNHLKYDGFNLVVGNRNHCGYFSNCHDQQPKLLDAGLYAVSNATLNTPWPKLKDARKRLSQWLNQPEQDLYKLLHNRKTYPEHMQPDTGVGQPWETLLSAAFITSEDYGTRASTALQVHADTIDFCEESYDKNGNPADLVCFNF